jgi:RimJ/RimL family protein N-acetyltransferase
LKIDWSQNEQHRLMAENAIGVQFRGEPTYWLSVIDTSGNVTAVVVYCGFTACSCEVSVVAFSRHAYSRKVLRDLFSYPFLQLGLRRLHAYTRADSTTAAEQLSRLGFRVEGLLRNWYPDCHGVLHGLLKEECKWI